MLIEDFYQVFWDSNGKRIAINDLVTGKSLPMPLENHEDHPWVIELRNKEAEYGELNLSDREPEPIPEIIGYTINKLLPSDRNIQSDRFPQDINYNTDLVIGLTTKTISFRARVLRP
jgi:hypothetical protein